eukprot:TRINITY_DN15790_c0_g1_i1.p1 TRINITY_DN15790_c0_g1~~TRINITY_DN15790_c0_g1_i1.p1  ORF type:complete len:151 (+),score=0.92 TRINITY_DN15790_c0_g1_i1:277-729(+)
MGYMPWWLKKSEEPSSDKPCPVTNRLLSLGQERDAPLPRWKNADLQEFAREDPKHGETVLLARRASAIATGGAVVGGLALTAYNYRYSRSAGGALLTLVVGTVTSWAVTEEAANVSLGLYRHNAMEANFKFLDWWAAKNPPAPASAEASH